MPHSVASMKQAKPGRHRYGCGLGGAQSIQKVDGKVAGKVDESVTARVGGLPRPDDSAPCPLQLRQDGQLL